MGKKPYNSIHPIDPTSPMNFALISLYIKKNSRALRRPTTNPLVYSPSILILFSYNENRKFVT